MIKTTRLQNLILLKQFNILSSFTLITIILIGIISLVTAQEKYILNTEANEVVTNSSLNKVYPAKSKGKKITDNLICPGTEGTEAVPFRLLSLPCQKDNDCRGILGSTYKCCVVPQTNRRQRCIQGVPKPLPEKPHESWLGRSRECPRVSNGSGRNNREADSYKNEPLAEIFHNEVRECTEDSECWPFRICCADFLISDNSIDVKSYCRAPALNLETVPFPIIKEPLQNILSYMQCTPPPPPLLDLFPKSCRNSFDCFPNLCCQEKGGKRYCRPPKRSILAVIAGVTQQLGQSYRERYLRNQKPSLGLE